MSFNLAKMLETIAPTLASMLAGPLAGTAVTALEGVFGLQPGAGMDGITQAIQTTGMTPEIIASMRVADQRHAEVLGQQNLDLEKLNHDYAQAAAATDAADRDSARKMQIATPSFIPAVLSTLVTVAIFAVVGAMMAGVKVNDNPVVMQLFGSLTTGWGTVMAYWFGTTRSSHEKDVLLAQSTPTVETK